MTADPVAALAEALHGREINGRLTCEKHWREPDKRAFTYPCEEYAAAILSALDGWHLAPNVATADWTGSTKRAVPDVEWLVQEIADGADIRVHANGCPATIEQDDNECRCVLRDVLAEMLPSGVETRRWREALTRIAAAEPPKWETWIARAALAPSEP